MTVAADACRGLSTRSSCAVMSCGVPSVAIVVNRTSRVSPFLKCMGRTRPPARSGDSLIAAVANYVTSRFGSKASRVTARDVAELRAQASQ